ncbi:hypothetical protein EJB05_21793, partial [Eragrostis curvula]
MKACVDDVQGELLCFSMPLAKTFTISNNCGHKVWPGILSSAGSPPLDSNGFVLAPNVSWSLPAPPGWSGRLWGRTLCSTDSATGDCGSGRLDVLRGQRSRVHAGRPRRHGLLRREPQSTGTNCTQTGCMADLNGACPTDLRVACKSAFEAFGSLEHCCTGEDGNPNKCRPSAYSQFLKNACPKPTVTPTTTPPPRSPAAAATPPTLSPSAPARQKVVVYFGGGRYGLPSSRHTAPVLGTGLVLLDMALAALAPQSLRKRLALRSHHPHLQTPVALLVIVLVVLAVNASCCAVTVDVSSLNQKTFAATNRCGFTVRPGILSSASSPPLDSIGFARCGRVASGAARHWPVLLAEFKLDGSGGMDFDDVSLVDGYNLPMLMARCRTRPWGSNSVPTECVAGRNGACPAELQVASPGGGVACKSACEAFRTADVTTCRCVVVCGFAVGHGPCNPLSVVGWAQSLVSRGRYLNRSLSLRRADIK